MTANGAVGSSILAKQGVFVDDTPTFFKKITCSNLYDENSFAEVKSRMVTTEKQVTFVLATFIFLSEILGSVDSNVAMSEMLL